MKNSKNKLARVEVLPLGAPVPATLAEKNPRAALQAIVAAEVERIMADGERALFEPWFRSRAVAEALKRLQTVPEQRKWAHFYEKRGCFRCGSKKRPHTGSGLCDICRHWGYRCLDEDVRELAAEYEAQNGKPESI